MRIDLNPKSTNATEAAAGAKPGAKAGAGPGRVSANSMEDRAEFSLDQKRVQELTALASSTPDIRQQKVAALAAAVRDGSYHVQPEQTAGAIMAEMFRSVA